MLFRQKCALLKTDVIIFSKIWTMWIPPTTQYHN